LSSASTLGRFESDEEYQSREFAQLAEVLAPAAKLTYAAARRWIDRDHLDAVCLFNGRIEATRAVLEAARDAGIPFISLERTWFGDGLQLYPGESCSGLRNVGTAVQEWRNAPLSGGQARRAASHVAARFLRKNQKEWRAYNVAARTVPWPVAESRYKVLLTPSSGNERWGNADWRLEWGSPTAGYDAVIDHLQLRPSDLILRCHPNWGEMIGARDGMSSERYFRDWAAGRGIRVIGSRDPTSTLGLIEQADAIILSGGSAALEAGILGKQVIGLGPSTYHRAGFQSDAFTPSHLAALSLMRDKDEPTRRAESESIARQTLRYCYTMAYRLPQFVQYVRSITTTRYEYVEGADPGRLTRALQTNRLEADDSETASTTVGEDEVLNAIREGAWESLMKQSEIPPGRRLLVRRRPLYRPLDRVRESLPRGDL
jgi:hypothetical protein